MLDFLSALTDLGHGADADVQMQIRVAGSDSLVGFLRLDALSGVIGASETSNSAPLGIWLTCPTMNTVAVSMSIPIADRSRSRSRNCSSHSQTRRFVV